MDSPGELIYGTRLYTIIVCAGAILKCFRSMTMMQSNLSDQLRAILCKYGASYIGTISRSDSDFDETC